MIPFSFVFGSFEDKHKPIKKTRNQRREEVEAILRCAGEWSCAEFRERERETTHARPVFTRRTQAHGLRIV